MEAETSGLVGYEIGKIQISNMEYDDWIKRERKIRTKLLESSPLIYKFGICRLCRDCGEICLCHEDTCPNCSSVSILECKLTDDFEDLCNERIRCRFRFDHIL